MEEVEEGGAEKVSGGIGRMSERGSMRGSGWGSLDKIGEENVGFEAAINVRISICCCC